MKKFIVILLVVCLVVAAAVVGRAIEKPSGIPVVTAQNSETSETMAAVEENAVSAPEQTDPPSTVPDEPTVASGRINYEALYAVYEPEEKVLSVDGREESWGNYFYFLFTQCAQIEDYFNAMAAYYGMRFSWDEPVEEDSDESFADLALESAETMTVQLAALEVFAEENGIAFDTDTLAEIEEQKRQDIISVLGEEGTKEEFLTYLEQLYLSEEMYDRLTEQNYLYQVSFLSLYGEDAS